MAHDLLGNLLSEFGRFEEARACFERAIAIAPMLAGSYYDLVRCRPVTSADDGLLARDASRLGHAGTGSWRNACGFTSRSAKRRRILATTPWPCSISTPQTPCAGAAASFDSAAFSIEIDRLIARCTPELIARASELGSRDATPVLIIGMPRSGTTLVEQIVSMHPEVGAGGELNFWNERGAAWHPLRRGRERDSVRPEFFAKAAADYLSVLRAIAPKAARVTDKMPFNFLWAGLIHVAFPRATHHSLPPRCHRHGAIDPSNSFPSGPGVSDRRSPNWSRISAATSGSWIIGGACCRRIASSKSITRN